MPLCSLRWNRLSLPTLDSPWFRALRFVRLSRPQFLLHMSHRLSAHCGHSLPFLENHSLLPPSALPVPGWYPVFAEGLIGSSVGRDLYEFGVLVEFGIAVLLLGGESVCCVH